MGKIVRAEKLIKQNRLKRIDRERLLHQKRKKPKKQAAGAKVVVAVRNGRVGGSREVKIALKALGLTECHTLVFLPNTEETAAKLQIIRPFAFWGMPSFKLVETVMQKKACFKDPEKPKQR